MAVIVTEIKLETSKPNLIQAIVAKQNDCNSRFLKVTFLHEGRAIPLLSSSKVTINAQRKDGNIDSFFGEVNTDDTATVPLHSWMLELDGEVTCDVSIIDVNERRLTSTSFVVLVEKTINGSGNASTDPQYNVLAELIEETSEIKQNASNALRCNASGNPVLIDDVSSLEHQMSVLAKGSIDVLGAGLEIKHYGKNLFDDVAFFEQRGFAKQSDGSYKGINLNGVIAITNESKASGSIYISYLGKTNSNSTPVCFKVVYTDGVEYLAHLNSTNGVFVKISAQTNSAKTVDRIEWYYGSGGAYYIKDLMFSFVDDEYEPYKEPVTYTTDENGEVSVTSIYPATTLIAPEGVTLDVDYNADTKKYIDKKFAELAAMIVNS